MSEPIRPLALPDLDRADLVGQAQGEFMRLPVSDLRTEGRYQRAIDPKRIRTLVERWSAVKCMPLGVVLTNEGFEVFDGQHRAVAAATHGGIETLPCFVFYEIDLPGRAQASVSAARDRKAHTPGQIWKAEVVAGDNDALRIQRICAAAGVTLLPYAPPGSAYKARETIALAAIRRLLDTRGEERAALVLAALADADLAPVDANSIRAADALLCEPEYAADFDVERLAASFRAMDGRAHVEAKELAAAKGLPFWRALVATIYKHRKVRPPAPPAAPAGATVHPMRRVIDRRPANGAMVALGDPEPGRSALDQRRAPAC